MEQRVNTENELTKTISKGFKPQPRCCENCEAYLGSPQETLMRRLLWDGLSWVCRDCYAQHVSRGVDVATEVYPIAWRIGEAIKELDEGNLEEVRDYLSEISRELNISMAHNLPMPPVFVDQQTQAYYNAFVSQAKAAFLADADKARYAFLLKER